MNIPYMIGRRAKRTHPVTDQQGDQGANRKTRAEDGGRITLQAIGWGTATFGAGAVLGWMASRKDRS